jgi:hypothetical protein
MVELYPFGENMLEIASGVESFLQGVTECVPRINIFICQRMWCIEIHSQFILFQLSVPPIFCYPFELQADDM